jgi:hypothetical protein
VSGERRRVGRGWVLDWEKILYFRARKSYFRIIVVSRIVLNTFDTLALPICTGSNNPIKSLVNIVQSTNIITSIYTSLYVTNCPKNPAYDASVFALKNEYVNRLSTNSTKPNSIDFKLTGKVNTILKVNTPTR